jgi:phosphate transport system protein
MRDAYHDQLDRLPGMTRLVAEAMDRASFALSETDIEAADAVIADGARLSRACEEAYAILASQPPVAADLRGVLAVAHAVGELDRMGRLAGHVAEAVRRRHPEPVVPAVLAPRFVEMGRLAVWLAVMAGRAIETQDAPLARTLVSVDDDMDDLHRTLFTVIGYRDGAYGPATAVDVALLSRHYERFADHAVSLARQATSVVTGGAETVPGQTRVPADAVLGSHFRGQP